MGGGRLSARRRIIESSEEDEDKAISNDSNKLQSCPCSHSPCNMEVVTEEIPHDIQPQPKRSKVVSPDFLGTRVSTRLLPNKVGEIEKPQVKRSARLAAKREAQISSAEPKPHTFLSKLTASREKASQQSVAESKPPKQLTLPTQFDTGQGAIQRRVGGTQRRSCGMIPQLPPSKKCIDVIDVEKVCASGGDAVPRKLCASGGDAVPRKLCASGGDAVPRKPRPQVALVIKKRWCDRIFKGSKIWEIRGNALTKRGRICIAQSKSQTLVGEVSR